MVSVEPGQWVTSTAGRDKGAHYLVLDAGDVRLVKVVDGERRPVTRPKRKNLRHLWVHDKVHSRIAVRLRKGKRITDAEIKAALEELVREEEEVG